MSSPKVANWPRCRTNIWLARQRASPFPPEPGSPARFKNLSFPFVMSATTSNPLILLVDDDTRVRRLCRVILERAGFLVVEADSAFSAQTVWRVNCHAIDLLITDHDMPGMTGLQLMTALRATRADLKVLMISGNCQESFPPSIPFLQKPFSPAELSEAVQRCLFSHP